MLLSRLRCPLCSGFECARPSQRTSGDRETEDQSSWPDHGALIWSVLKSRGEENTLSYFNLTVHQQVFDMAKQCIYDLGRKHLDDVINIWSRGAYFQCIDAVSGINGPWTDGHGEDAEEQASDLENTRFYTNSVPECSRIQIRNEYGFSSIRQCLSKRHLQYQFLRTKKEKLQTEHDSPEWPQSFNIS